MTFEDLCCAVKSTGRRLAEHHARSCLVTDQRLKGADIAGNGTNGDWSAHCTSVSPAFGRLIAWSILKGDAKSAEPRRPDSCLDRGLRYTSCGLDKSSVSETVKPQTCLETDTILPGGQAQDFRSDSCACLGRLD